jgi:hypothetical protein
LSEQLAQYGALGVVCSVLLGLVVWVARSGVARIEAQDKWFREVLVGLVSDTVAELQAVRSALEHAPCRPAAGAAAREVTGGGGQ